MMSQTDVDLLSDAVEEQKQLQKNISKNRQAMKSFALTTDETDNHEESLLMTTLSDICLDKL